MTIEHRRAAVVVALIASFMVFVDGSIVNLVLAQLTSQLHATPSELEWVVNAYTLAFAAVMLGAGTITDVLGAKRAFATGLVLFTVSSGACATAGSMGVLDLARLVQGCGAALLLPSALVIATQAVSDPVARHRLVGWWAAAGGVGMAAGPLLGGVLVAEAGWRAVFAVNVVLGVPVIAWCVRCLPASARRQRPLDATGMAAASVLIGGIVFALIEAPERGWLDPAVLVAAGLAVAGATGFVFAERTGRAPLLPLAVYSDRTFVSGAAQGALFNFTFYGLLFTLSLLLQQGRGIGALDSGLLFLPLTGLIAVGNLCAAPLAVRLGDRTVLALGQVLLTVALVTVAWASTTSSLCPLVLALLPAGFSSGVLVPSMTSQAISVVGPDVRGAAAAIFNTARQVGATVGVATLGPLFSHLGGTGRGFVVCTLAGAAASGISLFLTAIARAAPGPPVTAQSAGSAAAR